MTQENTALLEALEPFARCCEQIADSEPDDEWAKFRLTIGDYRRAKAAMEEFAISDPSWDRAARDEAIKEVVGLCNRIPGSTHWNAAEFMFDLLAKRHAATPTTDSLTADAAAVREAAAIAARDAMVAMEWPPQDGDRQIDEVMAAIRDMPLPAQAVPADVAALVVVAREAWEFLTFHYPHDNLTDALDKALEPFASRVCWDDEGGSLPDAHAVPCSCGKGGAA